MWNDHKDKIFSQGQHTKAGLIILGNREKTKLKMFSSPYKSLEIVANIDLTTLIQTH